ncbi:hypothetical protein [Burkholderia guangdongensis]|uniref:hypothetical protein n=1 Tax=Burkholderia guangdongensis TaxID=1792500 RepID=UPI001FE3567E|nr:hypothetical protein [Burkholderia guangdongensis]
MGTVHPRNSIRRGLVAFGVAVWFAGWGQAHGKTVMDSHMTQPTMTLWQAIDALAQQIPFSRTKIENVFAIPLAEADDEGNDVFQFFKSTPFELSDGVIIEDVDLRVKRKGTHPGFMVLHVGGSCVGLDVVRGRYNHLGITDVPHGRSLDDATTYSATLQWGKLSFGFKERNPGCLAFVSFEPKQDE